MKSIKTFLSIPTLFIIYGPIQLKVSALEKRSFGSLSDHNNFVMFRDVPDIRLAGYWEPDIPDILNIQFN